MKTRITGSLKWHGGKHYLAPKIIARMPKHLHYVEPFFGGGSVLFAREPDDPRFWLDGHKGVSEVINDVHTGLINFWRVLASERLFSRFRRALEGAPFSRALWENIRDRHNDPDRRLDMTDEMQRLNEACEFFVLCRQSRSGLMDTFSPLTRTRLRRGMNGNVSEWLGAIEGLPDVHGRLKRVVIENIYAIDLIPREDTPDTLFYCDPPYLKETRVSTEAYEHEMDELAHIDLAMALSQCEGKVMLSGYRSELYDELFPEPKWRRVEFDMPNHAAGGTSKRRMTECLWLNYPRSLEAIQ
jgi:DNA adenine methylase